MRYGSVCSGIEAATMAWHPLGWKPSFFSEIEDFPRAVLHHHYPDVPLHGDFTTIDEDTYDPIQLMVGGTPCQSFSIAGLRGGLGDDRGNLALEYFRLADRLRPRWLVWENVPGVLSSGGGRDFGAILGAMGALGYGWAYRVLDAQYVRTRRFPHAVPQRRRRVFVVGYFGDWRRAAAVLFDRESLSGHPPPRREAGQGVAPTISARPTGGGGLGTDFDLDGGLVESGWPADVAPTLNTSFGAKMGLENQHALNGAGLFVPSCAKTAVAHPLRGEGFDASEDGTGRETPIVPVAFDPNQITSKANRSIPRSDVLHTLPATAQPPHIAAPWAVRRLTPVECERLQGFPDGFTDIKWRGKDHSPDGRRYKTLGNSMAVNVMEWIGERIEMVDKMEKEQE